MSVQITRSQSLQLVETETKSCKPQLHMLIKWPPITINANGKVSRCMKEHYAAPQRQNTISAYLLSLQILPFDFARQYRICLRVRGFVKLK